MEAISSHCQIDRGLSLLGLVLLHQVVRVARMLADIELIPEEVDADFDCLLLACLVVVLRENRRGTGRVDTLGVRIHCDREEQIHSVVRCRAAENRRIRDDLANLFIGELLQCGQSDEVHAADRSYRTKRVGEKCFKPLIYKAFLCLHLP